MASLFGWCGTPLDGDTRLQNDPMGAEAIQKKKALEDENAAFLNIFSWLNGNDLISSTRLVNKKWKDLSNKAQAQFSYNYTFIDLIPFRCKIFHILDYKAKAYNLYLKDSLFKEELKKYLCAPELTSFANAKLLINDVKVFKGEFQFCHGQFKGSGKVIEQIHQHGLRKVIIRKGDFENSKLGGKGKKENGEMTWKGHFENDELNGYGIKFSFISGIRIDEGEFKNGSLHGKGKRHSCKYGETLVGEFIDGEFSG
jgi:hypothetical protein